MRVVKAGFGVLQIDVFLVSLVLGGGGKKTGKKNKPMSSVIGTTWIEIVFWVIVTWILVSYVILFNCIHIRAHA